MRQETPEKTARRLLDRMRKAEEEKVSEAARDEAQKLLLARHLERLRETHLRL